VPLQAVRIAAASIASLDVLPASTSTNSSPP
jgi:hypothetical protein